MTENQSTETILRDALAELREHGWVQHELDYEGQMCAAGALNLVTHGDPWWAHDEVGVTFSVLAGDIIAPLAVLARVIKEQYPDRTLYSRGWVLTVVEFNNHPDTTFADIEAVFEKAILLAASDEG